MNIKLLIVVLYMALMIAISVWSTWKIKNQGASGYLLAGKSVPWLLLATMVMGLSIGGTATTGVAQNAYQYGISAGWYGVSVAVAVLAFAAVVMKKAHRYNFGTAAEIFGRAFDKPEGFLCVLTSVIQHIGLYSLQIISGGAVLYGLLPGVFSLTSAQIVTAVIFLVISLLGGYLGAVMVNLINTLLIYIGLFIATFTSLGSVDGWGNLTMSLQAASPDVPWTNLISGAGIVTILSWMLTQVINGLANQPHFQLVASAKNYKNAKIGIVVGAILMLPVGFLCAVVGMVARIRFPELLASGETSSAFTMVVGAMHPLVGGLVLAGLWAAVVSTAIALNSGVQMLGVHVLIKEFFAPNMKDKTEVMLSRIFVVIVTLVSLFLALMVSEIVSLFMTVATFVVPQGVLLLLMFHFPKVVKKSSCVVSLIATLAAIVAWYLFPALHVFRELAYFVVVVTLACVVICYLVDKRPVDYSKVFVERDVQNS